MSLPKPSEIIDALGGTGAVAEIVGITAPSVSEWRSKPAIPKDKLAVLAGRIEKHFGIPKHEICPNVFEAPKARKRAG